MPTISVRVETRTFSPQNPPPAPTPEPTLVDELKSLREALARLRASGKKITPREARTHRAKTCAGCPLWSSRARFGLGKCRHSKCGCTRLKVWIASESCPAGKWPAVS